MISCHNRSIANGLPEFSPAIWTLAFPCIRTDSSDIILMHNGFSLLLGPPDRSWLFLCWIHLTVLQIIILGGDIMTDKNDPSRNKQPKVRSQQNPQSFFKQQNQDKPNNNTGNVK